MHQLRGTTGDEHATRTTDGALPAAGKQPIVPAHGAAVPAHAAGAPAWPGGPTVARKSRTQPYAQYLRWLHELDKFDKEDAISRLRRLYYGQFAGPGKHFDEVINTSNKHPPFKVPEIAQATLDGLFATDKVITPHGVAIDPSHIVAGLDVTLSQPTVKAQGGDAFKGVDPYGLITWVGDLAQWFVKWNEQRASAEHHGKPLGAAAQRALLLRLAPSTIGPEDLLGDLDAQVMSAEFTKLTPTYTAIPALIPSAKLTIAQMFEQMYSGERPPSLQPADKANSSNRFHYFVSDARPPIPHTALHGKPRRVQLQGTAAQAIRKHIHNDATILLAKYTKQNVAVHADDVERHGDIIQLIANDFVAFLQRGLHDGKVHWPPR